EVAVVTRGNSYEVLLFPDPAADIGHEGVAAAVAEEAGDEAVDETDEEEEVFEASLVGGGPVDLHLFAEVGGEEADGQEAQQAAERDAQVPVDHPEVQQIVEVGADVIVEYGVRAGLVPVFVELGAGGR